ncbi:MAG: hypothetical protein NTZ16_10335 [Verrucomicrobia bacterium]|nr:hypothetical protein [Verrucomicrobiota bacterium]
MIRAAYTPLVFTVLLTIAAPAFAQDEPANAPATAVQEAVRRQARTVELRQTLIEAGHAEQRKDLAGAFKFYQTAYKFTQEIGSGIDAETRAAVAGVSRVSYAIAQEAQGRGDYKAAATSIQSALRVDPKNEALLTLKKNNEAWLAAQAGKIPSQETKDRVAGVVATQVKNATAVQDGKLLYDLGKWDEAEAKFHLVLAEEPDNAAAIYYIKLVQDARYAASDSNRDLTARKRMVEVEDVWQPPLKRELLPTPNPYVRSKEIHTGAGRQAIVSKLDRIRLNEVKYDGLELGEVIRNLSELTRKSDPDKAGINFMIISDAGGGGSSAPGAVDPTTGLPVAAAPSEGVDISTVRVKINPPLNNLRLADVLDAIVKTAEKPIKYSIEDYAVVFSTRAQEATPLFTRTFKVDPNTFMQGLESVESLSFGDISSGGSSGGGGGGSRGGGGGGSGGQNGGSEAGASIARISVAGGGSSGGGRRGGGGGGGGGGSGGGGISFVTRTNSIEAAQAMVREFFTAAGVDFGGGGQGPGGQRSGPGNGKSLFFNDRKGILLVRATLQDLDIIEAAIQTLNVTPPQVNIQAKIAEVTQDDRNALGFNWYLGNTLMGNGNVGVQGGTAPTFAGAPTTANPSGIFPNPLLPQQLTDQLITGGLRNALNAPAVGTLSGILTDPQFRMVVNALEQRDGVDLVSAPSVTTLSGRQTHIEVTDILSIVTGLDANQTGSGGGGNNNNGGGGNNNGGAGAVGSTIQPTVQPLPFGPVLDVIPSVSADEYSIQMTIIPTITEFVGYDTSTFSVQAQGSTGNALIQQVPLPHLRTRQVTTSVVVWDGQTVVLGGLISEEVIKAKDKVPIIGDLPLLGRLFRSESASKVKKNLLIFVTPTIIDPAGNRVHSDEEMPFAQSSIPPQRPGAAKP